MPVTQKQAGPDLSNMPQQQTCTKLHFLVFLKKKKERPDLDALSFFFLFLIPHLITHTHTHTFWFLWRGGVVGWLVYDENGE